MRYLPLESITLIEQRLTKTTKEKKPQGLHHIFIYDRSGSMYHALPDLIKDMKNRFRACVTPQDTVTIGWFSGRGEFRFPLVGHRIHGSADFATLDKILDANSSTIGMTCFSEILTDARKVVSDLAPLGNTFSLTFLTDGCPTVSPISEEISRIKGAIDEIAGHIAMAFFVGYGPYYNKELMGQMAARAGGTAIHSEDLRKFPVLWGDFVENSRGTGTRIQVQLGPQPIGNVFTIEKGEIRTYEPTSHADIWDAMVSPDADNLYYFTNGYVGPVEKIDANSTRDHRIFYAAALAQVRACRPDLALEVLGALGDRALIDAVVNAFTNAEYGAAETLIAAAIGRPGARFVGGRQARYVPPRDAFCLVQALELLEDDPKAAFLPVHPDFAYRRIGAKRTTQPGYPEFTPQDDVKADLTGLVWNEEKLNLSIQTRIPGTIQLPDISPSGLKRPDLDPTFKTFIWRNYAIVKDGALNVTKLPVILGKELFPKLRQHGLLPDGSRFYVNKAYTLDLIAVPIMNRAMADGLCSAEAMAKAQIEIIKLKGELKALKWCRDQLEPREDRELGMHEVTEEQEAFLKACGVTSNGFSPPTEGQTATDYYMARTLTLKVKGETLPSIKDVLKRDSSKLASLGTSAVISGLSLCKAAFDAKDVVAIKGMIETKNRKMKMIRREMQRARFAILLGKRWFDGFKSMAPEDCILTVDGLEVRFILGEERVEL